MQTLKYVIGKDYRPLTTLEAKSSNVSNIDYGNNPNWVQARQYEDGLRQVFVEITNEDGSPYDLTGSNVLFEGILPDNEHKILDNSHAVFYEDPTSGKFRFDLPAAAFAVAGQYKQAFFRITKGYQNVATLEFKLEVLADMVISGLVPSDYISPLEDFLTEVKAAESKTLAELKDTQNKTLDDIKANGDKALATLQDLEIQNVATLKKIVDDKVNEINNLMAVTNSSNQSVLSELTNAKNLLVDLQTKIKEDGLFTKYEADNLFKEFKDKTQQLSQKVDTSMSEAKTLVENKIAQIDNGVHGYPNANAIKQAYPNGAQGIFVAVDTGHQWYYVNGRWTDGGVYQSEGIAPALQADIDNALIGNGLYTSYESVPAELRLFDNAPNNTIMSFDFDVSQYPDMHAPANSGKGVLVTLSHSDHKHVTSGGKFQLFHSQNRQMWSRVCWTGDNAFAPWVSLNRQDPAIVAPIDEAYANNNPVYADLNTIPSGTYTYYSNSYVANTPDVRNNYGFTVSTFEYGFSLDPNTNNKGGRVQLLVTIDGMVLSRISWGNDVSYTDWEVLNTSYGLGVWYNSETDEIEHRYNNNFKGEYDLTNASALQPQSVVTYPEDGPKNGVGQATYVTYNGVVGLGGKAQFAFKANGELYYRLFWGGSPTDDKPWSKVKIDEPVTPPYLSLFEKVAVIGDSYASGEIYDKDGRNQHGDQYNHSWLAILSRKYGFNYYNYSRGGQTAYGWMHESARAHGDFTTDNKHYDLYFLNLGINDHDRNPADYAGVKADIANGTNSFYGEYGRIIETIKAKDPNAPIAIATITTSFGNGNHKRYNDVIRALASDYNLLLIDFGDNITNETIKAIAKRGGHPDAVGYAKLAQAFDDGFNNAVTKQEADISSLKELFSD